jgi:hypothetical protein
MILAPYKDKQYLESFYFYCSAYTCSVLAVGIYVVGGGLACDEQKVTQTSKGGNTRIKNHRDDRHGDAMDALPTSIQIRVCVCAWWWWVGER